MDRDTPSTVDFKQKDNRGGLQHVNKRGTATKGTVFLFLKSISELKRILYRIAEDWNVDAPLHSFAYISFLCVPRKTDQPDRRGLISLSLF